MIKIRCDDCGRVIDYDEDNFSESLTCRECGGYFSEIEDNEQSEDEDEIDCDEEYEEFEEPRILGIPIESEGVPSIYEGNAKEKFNPEAKTKFD